MPVGFRQTVHCDSFAGMLLGFAKDADASDTDARVATQPAHGSLNPAVFCFILKLKCFYVNREPGTAAIS